VAVYGIEAENLRLVMFSGRFEESVCCFNLPADAEVEPGNKHQSGTFSGVDVLDIRVLALKFSDGWPAENSMLVRWRWMKRSSRHQERLPVVLLDRLSLAVSS
jgi:hypothetical protein